MASKSKGNNIKKRNWWFVLYPESAPENWRDLLQQTGLPCAISPLHDKDVYDDGERKGLPKKPHYHVILVYGNPTTYNNVLSLTNGQLGQTIPQALDSVRGAFRYLTHVDHPDKYQYSKEDITYLNGSSFRDFEPLTESEIDRILWDIQGFVMDNDITEYADLVEVLRSDGYQDWWSVARKNTVFLMNYIRSRKFRRNGREREVE